MSEQLTAPTAVISSDAVVEVQLPLGAGGSQVWCEIPGAAGTDVDNGERSINEVETYRGTVIQTGEKSKPTITIDISSLLPHMPVMREIVRKFEDNETLPVRWFNPRRVISALSQGANNTCDISTAGTVSFNAGVPNSDLVAFASDRVAEGMSIFTGSSPNQRDYIIVGKTIAANGVLTSFDAVDSQTLDNPTSAVSDEPFGFRIPQVAMPDVVCEIMSAGNQSGSVGQAGLTSQLVLRALSNLPAMVVQEN